MLKLYSTLCKAEFKYIANYTDPEIYLGGYIQGTILVFYFFLFLPILKYTWPNFVHSF